jgi:hypothetical protein
MTKVTLGHLINTLGREQLREDRIISDELLVKHAIKLAEETCRQLDLKITEEEPGKQNEFNNI